ncbi:MAG: carboxypeptidase-like regulatory domain-containing protein [Blastocatellia bacterium]
MSLSAPENLIPQLSALLDELRVAGYDIGPAQYIAVQDLTIGLAGHNQWPADVGRLKTLVGPLLCSTPAEQEDFHRRFDDWIARFAETDDGDRENHGQDETGSGHKIGWRWPRWLKRMPALARLSILATLILLPALGTWAYRQQADFTLAGTVVDENNNAVADATITLSGASAKSYQDGQFTLSCQTWRWSFNRADVRTLSVEHPEFELYQNDKLSVSLPPTNLRIQLTPKPAQTIAGEPDPTPDKTPWDAPTPVPLLPEIPAAPAAATKWYEQRWLQIAALALPLFLTALWLLARRIRRQMLLQRLSADGAPQISRINVTGLAEWLFTGQPFRRIVQELRRHRRLVVQELDPEATVEATVRQGGLFTPAFAARKTLPEYLLLIDRASMQDEQAQLGEELARRLAGNAVFIETYYFQRDPRTCRKREPHSPVFTPAELAVRHPDHRLVMFSDGAGLISPVTGQPETWLSLFEQWPQRALLTPAAADDWDWRERAIEDHGFIALPAISAGLDFISEAFRTGVPPQLNRRPDDRPPMPALLTERPKRWLERDEPEGAIVERLLRQTRQYLGETCWRWLCACAVYPELSWELTLFLGARVTDARETFEPELVRLLRLPWFRYGTMPDWLRTRLIAAMPQEEQQSVRQAIHDLLLSALDHPGQLVSLEIARRQSPEPQSRWEKPGATLRRWREWMRLKTLVRSQAPASPLRDYVFLDFLAGRKPRDLSVNVPDALRRLFFPNGQSILGLRPATVMAAALLCAAVIGVVAYRINQREKPVIARENKRYLNMTEAEKVAFVEEQAQNFIVSYAGGGRFPVSGGIATQIRSFVDAYANRVGTEYNQLLSDMSSENMQNTMARGIAAVPLVSQAANDGLPDKQVRALMEIYAWMAESEFYEDSRNPLKSFVPRQLQSLFKSSLSRTANTDPGRFLLYQQASAAINGVAALRQNGLTSGRSLNDGGMFSLAAAWDPAFAAIRGNATRIEDLETQINQANSSGLDLKPAMSRTMKFLAAGVVGENPRRFGLDMEPLSKQTGAALTPEELAAIRNGQLPGAGAGKASVSPTPVREKAKPKPSVTKPPTLARQTVPIQIEEVTSTKGGTVDKIYPGDTIIFEAGRAALRASRKGPIRMTSEIWKSTGGKIQKTGGGHAKLETTGLPGGRYTVSLTRTWADGLQDGGNLSFTLIGAVLLPCPPTAYGEKLTVAAGQRLRLVAQTENNNDAKRASYKWGPPSAGKLVGKVTDQAISLDTTGVRPGDLEISVLVQIPDPRGLMPNGKPWPPCLINGKYTVTVTAPASSAGNTPAANDTPAQTALCVGSGGILAMETPAPDARQTIEFKATCAKDGNLDYTLTYTYSLTGRGAGTANQPAPSFIELRIRITTSLPRNRGLGERMAGQKLSSRQTQYLRGPMFDVSQKLVAGTDQYISSDKQLESMLLQLAEMANAVSAK